MASNRLSSNHLPLVRDLSDWDRTIRGLANQQDAELHDLVVHDRILPLPTGTGLLVEEDYATLVRVRVLDGDHRGATGWLPSGLLQHRAA